MFEEKIALSELTVAQGTSNRTVYLQTTLLDNGMSGMKLVLTDGEDVWKGEVSEDDLDKLSTRLPMDFKKFVTQSVSALTREALQDITYEYHLKALPSNRMQLVWKKCVAADDIKFQLGHVNLEKLDSSSQSLCRMLNQCVTVVSLLKKQIDSLETDNERLARDRGNAIKRLEKCITAKTELESDLYSKFVAILNSKKEKIRELEEDKPSEVRDRSPVTGTSKRGSSPSLSPPTHRNGQPSTSTNDRPSYDVDTDEEAEAIPRKQMRQSYGRLKADGSINLGDEEDETTTVPVARRARKKAPAKKPTVSKPVLPKVTSTPSVERPSNTSRRTSLRKSGSNTSKTSENTDDLLEEM